MTVGSGWDAERVWLVTEFRVTVDVAAVDAWRAYLMETVVDCPVGTVVKIVYDVSGMES